MVSGLWEKPIRLSKVRVGNDDLLRHRMGYRQEGDGRMNYIVCSGHIELPQRK